jgi:hypothetical protein
LSEPLRDTVPRRRVSVLFESAPCGALRVLQSSQRVRYVAAASTSASFRASTASSTAYSASSIAACAN